MSNSKKTIKGVFSDMFGNGKNLNVGKNKSTNELLNNIPNSNLNSNEIIENSIQNSRSKNLNSEFGKIKPETNENKNLERKESLKVPLRSMLNTIPTISSPISFKTIYVIIIIIILLILALLFFYRDVIVNYFKPPTEDIPDDATIYADAAAKASSETSSKIDIASKKVESTSEKLDDLNKKVDQLIVKNVDCSLNSSPAINTLNTKLNNISPYKQANVTGDAYCYIGYDNGQRECVDVHAGDVCMSGEIFPTLDICINPTLRQ